MIEIINSPAFISLLAMLFLYGLNYLYSRKPLWQQFEGTIIAAIKWAEKTIPNAVENKSLSKLDTALQYVIRVYTEARGTEPTAAQKQQLIEAIQMKHEELEAHGTLPKKGK